MTHGRKPKTLLMRITGRIGRRGSFLMFLSLLDLLFGFSLLFPVVTIPKTYDLLLSPAAWGLIWLVVGVVLFIQAFARVDRIGYVCAVVIKFCWATVALYDWVYTVPDPRGWIPAVIWYAFAALTAIVSYWPEHTMPQIGVFNGDDD